VEEWLGEKLILDMGQCLKSVSFDLDNQNWAFIKATMYAWTLGTTIGYGTFVPATDLGRALTVVYSSVAIPFFIWNLSLMIELLKGSVRPPWAIPSPWDRPLTTVLYCTVLYCTVRYGGVTRSLAD